MRKHFLFILCALCTRAYARETESALESTPQIVDSVETLRVDTLEMDSIEQIIESMADTLVLEPIFPQHWSDSTLSDIDFRMMEWAMGWLDTTGCVAYKDTIVLPDSVYKARLQALPCVVELPYNQIVKRFILRYVQRGQKQVARMKRMSEYYFPIFEEALDRYGLPYELELMPVIESALNPQAHSHMGAAGLWQFMPATGKRYGLEINSLVDERMDPIKSTETACRFLKAMYDVFQDWNLVIAAYNCGSGNVSKAIHRAGGKRDFWSIYPYLPRETRSYLPIFIAANYAMNYSDEHGICPAPLEKIMLTDTILTNRRLHLEQVSTKLEIPLDELRRLNPQYTRDILPGGTTYALCLPSEKAGLFIEQQDSIYAHKADQLINNRRAEIDMAKVTDISGAYRVNGVIYYTIKNGDTLGGIAKKFRCSVKQLKAWNGLKNDNIRAGRKLKIYK
mgnify:FL=1